MGSGNPESNWKEIRGQEIPKITRKKPEDRESQKQWTKGRGHCWEMFLRIPGILTLDGVGPGESQSRSKKEDSNPKCS
jgi:hypothetical protein